MRSIILQSYVVNLTNGGALLFFISEHCNINRIKLIIKSKDIMQYTIAINDQKCIKCGKCAALCPASVFNSEKQQVPITEYPNRCIECGHCVAICPSDAICHTTFPTEKVHRINSDILPSPKQMSEIIKARRSNRVFTTTPVSMEDIQQIIDAAHHAPTATNAQQVAFTVITSPEKLREVSSFTVSVFTAIAKKLSNPILKPILKVAIGGAYKYVPAFSRMKQQLADGDDPILRGATAVIFFHSPSSIMFGKEDCNLAYQNASLMAEALGVAQFYTGFVCSASNKAGNKKLAKILGVDGNIVYAGMALGMPKYKFTKHIDKRDVMVNYW